MLSKKLSATLGAVMLALSAQVDANCDRTTNNVFPNSSPVGRYILEAGERDTVLDTRTGLRWRRCPLTNNNVSIVDANTATPFDETCDVAAAQRITWNEALTLAQAEVTGAASWRLPNIKELMSIVGVECHAPAVDSSAFPSISSLQNTAINDDGDGFVDDIRIDLPQNAQDEPTAQENTLLMSLTRLVWTSTPHMLQDGDSNPLGAHKTWAIDINTGRLLAVRRDSKAYVYIVR